MCEARLLCDSTILNPSFYVFLVDFYKVRVAASCVIMCIGDGRQCSGA
jgi:hypothetical protein